MYSIHDAVSQQITCTAKKENLKRLYSIIYSRAQSIDTYCLIGGLVELLEGNTIDRTKPIKETLINLLCENIIFISTISYSIHKRTNKPFKESECKIDVLFDAIAYLPVVKCVSGLIITYPSKILSFEPLLFNNDNNLKSKMLFILVLPNYSTKTKYKTRKTRNIKQRTISKEDMFSTHHVGS
jgi:hypothetical protein